MNNCCDRCGDSPAPHRVEEEAGPTPECPMGYGCEMWLCEACFMERLERLHAEMMKGLQEDGGVWPIYTGDGE